MPVHWLSQWPKRLSRITSSGSYIAEVDGLRFMAIVPVLLQHLSERLQRYADTPWATPLTDDPVVFWTSRGTIGVFLFFAISGFILGLPFAKHHLHGSRKVELRPYFWRRLTRLEPPYMVWMTVFFVVLLIKGGTSFGALFPHWAASLGYVHNLVYESYSVINPVAWSLEVEIQFYLVAPLLAWLFFRWQSAWLRRGLLVSGIVGILVAQWAFGWAALPYKLTLLWELQHFLVGFLVADFFLTEWRGKAAAGSGRAFWDMLALPALIILCLTWSEDLPKRLLFAVALLLFLVAGFRGRYFTRLLRNPWVAAIGGMCYTIYLIHLPLLEALTPFTSALQVGNVFGINLAVQAVLLLPIVLAVSAVGFLLLEKPCMNPQWPQQLVAWWKNRTTRVPSKTQN